MKRNQDYEEGCYLCEHSQEIFGGDYYICKKKGVVDPNGLCNAFCFDPLKIKVSVRKIPSITPLADMMSVTTEKKEAE